MKRYFWFTLIIPITVVAAMALAQGETASVEIDFQAFSANPQFFVYKTTNHLDEVSLIVSQVGSALPTEVRSPSEDTSARDILMEWRETYSLNYGGETGTSSPSGYSSIITADAGANVTVSVSQNGRSQPLGSIARMVNAAQTSHADFELGEVIWNHDETVAVVIVHQSLAGDWPVEVDVAQGFSIPARPESTAPE
jgi:hypothetical protein